MVFIQYYILKLDRAPIYDEVSEGTYPCSDLDQSLSELFSNHDQEGLFSRPHSQIYISQYDGPCCKQCWNQIRTFCNFAVECTHEMKSILKSNELQRLVGYKYTKMVSTQYYVLKYHIEPISKEVLEGTYPCSDLD